MKTYIKIIGWSFSLALVTGVAIRIWSKWKPLNHLREPEDIDAYNADDGQPPFDEVAPRDRKLARLHN